MTVRMVNNEQIPSKSVEKKRAHIHWPLHKNFPKLRHICCKRKTKTKTKDNNKGNRKTEKNQFLDIFFSLSPCLTSD